MPRHADWPGSAAPAVLIERTRRDREIPTATTTASPRASREVAPLLVAPLRCLGRLPPRAAVSIRTRLIRFRPAITLPRHRWPLAGRSVGGGRRRSSCWKDRDSSAAELWIASGRPSDHVVDRLGCARTELHRNPRPPTRTILIASHLEPAAPSTVDAGAVAALNQARAFFQRSRLAGDFHSATRGDSCCCGTNLPRLIACDLVSAKNAAALSEMISSRTAAAPK